jgi:hypothetical protein
MASGLQLELGWWADRPDTCCGAQTVLSGAGIHSALYMFKTSHFP